VWKEVNKSAVEAPFVATRKKRKMLILMDGGGGQALEHEGRQAKPREEETHIG
jgi:hypothetical protein